MTTLFYEQLRTTLTGALAIRSKDMVKKKNSFFPEWAFEVMDREYLNR